MRTFRLTRILAAGLLAAGVLFVLASPASAAPRDCEHAGAAYPPAGCGESLSATTVTSGDDMTATGAGFASGESVTGTAFSTPMSLGTKPADSAGSVSFTFSTVSMDPGAHHVELRGTSGALVSASFTVMGAGQGSGVPANASANGASANASANGSSTGELAFTGSNAVIPMGIIGAVLIAAGGAAMVVTRRRRSTPTDY